MRCAAGLDATLGDGHLGGGGFHYLYAVGGHQGDPRGSPRRVSERPARCISRATPLGEPICNTRSTGRKSTPRSRLEVQTTALSAPCLRPSSTQSHLARQRAVVQGDQPGPVRPRIQQRLIPDFRLRAGIGEHQGGRGGVDLFDHLRQHAQAEMTGPGEALDARRQQGVDAQVLSTLPCTSLPLPGCSSTSSAWGWLPRVAERPQTISSGIHWRRRASASCSCTPRLLPKSSCHSSTTSMRKPAKAWRASARVSRVRLSGVVTSALGRRRPAAHARHRWYRRCAGRCSSRCRGRPAAPAGRGRCRRPGRASG